MTAASNPSNVHQTVSELPKIFPTLLSGTFCCVADLYAKLNAGDWNDIPLPTRQQIGIEFYRLIQQGPGSTQTSAWLRPMGKNEREQTVYEVVRHRGIR
jgi:hypothetical protein